MHLPHPRRPSRPVALAGAAAVLAAAALAVSVTTAVTAPSALAANAFYSAADAVPELSVGVSCAPGTNTGTATVFIGSHTSSAPWRATLTDTPADQLVARHPFSEWGKSPSGWTAPYPITGRGVVSLASDQSWVAVGMGTVPYDCHP